MNHIPNPEDHLRLAHLHGEELRRAAGNTRLRRELRHARRRERDGPHR